MKIDFFIIKPVFILYLLWFIETAFQYDMDLDIQCRIFCEDILNIFILPTIICSAIKSDYRTLKYCEWAIIVSAVIIIVYNFVLYWIPDINPYVLAMSSEHDTKIVMDQFEFYREGFDKRLSSVFSHPMNFGMYLGLLMAFFMYMFKDNKKYMYLIIITVITIFISGVRTTMAAFFIVVLFFLLLVRKYTYFLYTFVIVLSVYVLAPILFPSLMGILGSFTQSSEESGGSSMGMRIEQFYGCITEISNNPLFGKGYGWAREYMRVHGSHSVIKCFESYLFTVVCNWGWLGFLFLIGCFYWMFWQIHLTFINSPINRYILYCLWIYFLSYAFITGDYGYMRYGMLFYSIMYCGMKYNVSNKDVRIVATI